MALQIQFAADPEHPALLLELPWQLPLEEWPEHYLVPLPAASRGTWCATRVPGPRSWPSRNWPSGPPCAGAELLRSLDRLSIPAVDPARRGHRAR